MSYPIDLSITGKPSPRVEHPRSAGKRSQTPLNANRARSLQSDIFPTKDESSNYSKSVATKNNPVKNRPKSAVKFKKEEVSPYAITKSELEGIKHLTKDNVLEEAEKIGYGVYASSRKAAPIGVPQLSLDEITGADDLGYTKGPEKDECDASGLDSVSWGTPVKQKSKTQNVKGGGWQVSQSRPASVKAPSSRKHEDVPDLDLKLSQSNEALGQLREAVRQVNDNIQIEYLGKPKEELDHLKKVSKERKNQLFEEAILADQMSNLQTKSETVQAYSPFGPKPGAKLKRHNDLYSSSTTTVGYDGDVSKRVRFGARILTLNGHDARREINGFFITSDNTVAMYEFRQFGTRSKALPIIQRGTYKHLRGHRRGETFHLLDITSNKNLIFETELQPCLPDSLKKRNYVTFRITDVDDDDKETLLFHKCRSEKDRKEVQDLIRFYFNREENAEKDYITKFRSVVRNSMRTSGEQILTNLLHHFKQMDMQGDGLLRKILLKEALQKFRISIEDQDFENVWKMLDVDRKEVLDYGEFIRGYIGEMTEERKQCVRKAFSRLDPNKRGSGELNDIRKYFCPSKHPSVAKGEITEAQLLDEFIQCFKPSRQKTEITYSEFEAYYEGLSIGIDSDQSFINLVRMSWNI